MAVNANARWCTDRPSFTCLDSLRKIRRGCREFSELPRRAEVGFIRLRPCLVAKSGKADFAGEREPSEPAARASIKTRVARIIIAPAWAPSNRGYAMVPGGLGTKERAHILLTQPRERERKEGLP